MKELFYLAKRIAAPICAVIIYIKTTEIIGEGIKLIAATKNGEKAIKISAAPVI